MIRRWVVVALLVVGGCDDSGNTADMGMDLNATVNDLSGGGADLSVPDLSASTSLARGQELVDHLLLCGTCHTTLDNNNMPSTKPADYLAGGRKFTVNAGGDAGMITVYAPNLTPDDATGLGTWTESQIADAIQVGVDSDGAPLWPTMPYQRFANLTNEDAMAIAAYLKSLPPQSHAVPEDTGHPASAATTFDYTTLPHTTLATTDASYASAERGRYLANLGCVSCHTGNGTGPTGVDVTKAFAGGRSFGGGVKSSNLTPDATGLGGWTIAEIIATLKTDKQKGTGRLLLAPMPGGTGVDQVGGLSADDLTDLAQFLHTLPPVANGPFGPPDM